MGNIPKVVHLTEVSEHIGAPWSPMVVGEVNNAQVKLALFHGTFDWHFHEDEDECFFVVRGAITMHFRDGSVPMGVGDLIVVPRGVEHRPESEEESWVILVEPSTTRNTGNLTNEKTVERPERWDAH